MHGAPEEFDQLSPDLVAKIMALTTTATEHDGTPPLSEEARLALRATTSTHRTAVHLVVRDGGGDAALAYAQLSGHTSTLELVVDPAHRGRGLGTSLLAAAAARAALVAGSSGLLAWSHGDSPAAAALAARGGWVRSRELWRMGRSLAAADDPSPLPEGIVLPDGVLLRTFEVGRDEAAWLDLNARAFVDHPEQGRWSADDLRARQAEDWFRADDILLAVDAETGALLASHWTKVEALPEGAEGAPESEVYVVAVDPGAQGTGLGRAILVAGLHHLRNRGARHVDLYVEGDNERARALYTRLGFVRTGLDVQYSLHPSAV